MYTHTHKIYHNNNKKMISIRKIARVDKTTKEEYHEYAKEMVTNLLESYYNSDGGIWTEQDVGDQTRLIALAGKYIQQTIAYVDEMSLDDDSSEEEEDEDEDEEEEDEEEEEEEEKEEKS